MSSFLQKLPYDPINVLLKSNNDALKYFVKRDILKEEVPAINYVWELEDVKKIINKQESNGAWKYTGKKVELYPPHHYPLVATFKIFRKLVEKYELNKNHVACRKASEFIFSCQTDDGDIRGMIGNQYATYYTGYILSLLIKAGYENDKRVIKGLEWLLFMRQDDGGWTIPLLTHKLDKAAVYKSTSEDVKPLEPDRKKPFSHNWTNMVLQGFAVHPKYNHTDEIINAGKLLKSRFFKKDVYASYQSPYSWVRFAFWWPNLLTALESLQKIGFTKDDPDISLGLKWFITHQQKDGLWKLDYYPGKKPQENLLYKDRQLWISFFICRMLNNYYV